MPGRVSESPSFKMADRQSLNHDEDDVETDILYQDDILEVCDEGSSEGNG